MKLRIARLSPLTLLCLLLTPKLYAADARLEDPALATLEAKLQSVFLQSLQTEQGESLLEEFQTAEELVAHSAQRLQEYGLMNEYDFTVDEFGRASENPGGIAGVARRAGNAAGAMAAARNHRNNKKYYLRCLLDLEVYTGNAQWKSLTSDEAALVQGLIRQGVDIPIEEFPNLRRLRLTECRRKIQDINVTYKQRGIDEAAQVERGKLYAEGEYPYMAIADLSDVLSNNPEHPDKEELLAIIAQQQEIIKGLARR